MDVRIEPATERDIPLILQLIKALAEYERLSHEVVATEQRLRDSLFGERGILGLRKAREEHARLLQEVETLEADNARLSAQIRALRSDPLVVERMAREILGMARPGEIVLTIRQPEAR